jgi:1-acyl-sn-glycerol-3-phosphate acyltransferase
MEDGGPQSGHAELAAVEQRVLDVVRQLAEEVGGPRARRAAAAGASLERDVGLGSLERVELQLRLESAFGRRLGDAVLRLDTPAALARALVEAGAQAPERPAPEAVAVPAAAPAPESAATLQEALWRRAQSEPARPHVFLREEDGSEQTLSYGRLLAEASAVAGGLREQGVRRGETVALMLPTGLDFLRSFQGVLLAGGVPVPIYPPARLDRLQEYTLRQAAILADAGARILITIERALPVASLLRSRAPSLRHVTTAQALAEGAAGSAAPAGSATDAALIQYTSGSTGQPKGVLLTHANLLANIKAIAAGLALRPTDVGVSWLPLYHDMGLIGSWLFCLYHGIPIEIQSPLAFLARPERWLWAIHRRRATLSAGPNFAYELCARKVPDAALEGLDLGSWRCALNGAEPVNPDTLERFAKRFARYGFAREALLPVYGLAESSVALCFPPSGRGPRIDTIARRPFESEDRAEPAPAGEPQPLRFASVGAPLPGHEARVVDESGAELPERRVGRLVFRGPSATPGYFGKPEATRAITLAGGWLDSGDLAYRAGGELYIAGRLKDLIIKAGRNLVPQEIEEAAEVEGVRKGCVAAFGVAQQAQGTESLVVVAETRVTDEAARERLAGAVTQAVAAALDLPPDVVVLAPPGAVPKTSSGKIRRGAARELYLRGQLGRAPRTSPGQWLRLAAALAGRRAAAAFRALGRALYAGYLALLLPAAALAAWGVLQAMRSRASVQRFQRACARALLRVAGCRLSATGLERLGGGRGPFLLVCNHTSYVDVPALVALLPLDFVFLAKREAAGWPLVGSFLRKAGHLLVDRFDAQQSVAVAAEVARAIEAGRSVLVFPEGTFARASGLRPFRLGAFKTAVDTGATVVPLALRGARRVLRDRSWLPRPGPIHLWVGDPIRSREESWRAVVELRDRAAEAIGAQCGEPRLDLVFGGLPSPAAPAEPGSRA